MTWSLKLMYTYIALRVGFDFLVEGVNARCKLFKVGNDELMSEGARDQNNVVNDETKEERRKQFNCIVAKQHAHGAFKLFKRETFLCAVHSIEDALPKAFY